MSPAFLFTRLLRNNNNISVYSATTPATFLHKRCLFLRRISSNTTSAAADAQLSSQSSPVESAVSSSKRLENPHPPTLISTSNRKKELNREYTVSYLVESCGLSPKDAASASEKMSHFATPVRPDSVLDLLRSHGFSSTQVTRIVRQFPQLLTLNAEENILPKLQFLYSIGLSKKDIVPRICYHPDLLKRSLKNHIEPVCKWIKSFVQSDERVCTAIKNSSWIINRNLKKVTAPNVEVLQAHGVTSRNIALFLTHLPGVLSQNHEEFSAGVSKVKEMGFDPSKSNFVMAVHSISGKSNRQIWDRSYKIYSTKWGLSEEDILSAFKKHPHCMIMSEKKLNSAMEFLVNTMGWSPKCIAQEPIVILFSLVKRIIPRCSVIRVLWTKGLLSKDFTPASVLVPGEKDFLKRFVTKYEDQVPQLLIVYKGKMDALDLQ